MTFGYLDETTAGESKDICNESRNILHTVTRDGYHDRRLGVTVTCLEIHFKFAGGPLRIFRV